jgi:hypothetical protein
VGTLGTAVGGLSGGSATGGATGGGLLVGVGATLGLGGRTVSK